MLNIAEIVTDPDWNQNFNVIRTTGTRTGGQFVTSSPTTIPMNGVIQPLNTKDLQMLPEGDLIKGGIKIFTTVPLNATAQNPSVRANGSLSDQVVWHGENWKILQVEDQSDYGYYKSVATRLLGG